MEKRKLSGALQKKSKVTPVRRQWHAGMSIDSRAGGFMANVHLSFVMVTQG